MRGIVHFAHGAADSALDPLQGEASALLGSAAPWQGP